MNPTYEYQKSYQTLNGYCASDNELNDLFLRRNKELWTEMTRYNISVQYTDKLINLCCQ